MLRDSRTLRSALITLALSLMVASPAVAQDDEPADDEEPAAEETDEPADDEAPDEADEPADDEAPDEVDEPADDADEPADDEAPDEADEAPDDETDVSQQPAFEERELGDDEQIDDEQVDDADDEWPDEFDDDDFEDFADAEDIEFTPLDELDNDMLNRITPVATFPYVDWSGQLRTRTQRRSNFDLGTEGTSAVLPPVDTQVPGDRPADPDADSLWTADLRFRLAPTLHLTESLRVNTDVDLLHNVAMGADPRHNYFFDGQPSADRRISSSSAGGPSPFHVREAYGEFDAFFGTIEAGRMLDHWGLGITANDGDCADCDWGDQVDRLALRTGFWDLYARASYDLPDAGLAPRPGGFDHGAPHRLAQFDNASQWTLSVYRAPETRQDQQQQTHDLAAGDRIYNGGLYFAYQSQTGEFEPEQFSIESPDDPIYRGQNLYRFSPWAEFLWEPDPDQHIRLELEGIVNLGGIDNTTNDPVGFEDESPDADNPTLNCFDDDVRDANQVACRRNADGESTYEFVQQYGLAAESEFDFGGPVSFGLNSGFASGGEGSEDAGKWGWDADPRDQLAFTRFSPDYHVDLILFREVIGTVTNAYYANPYVMAKFFDTGLSHMELQFDSIVSRAFDPEGTPGDSSWLGLEFNSSLRYVDTESFDAALDAGILFPFGGLAAREGRDRLNYYGEPGAYTEDIDPSLAWTLQGRLNWHF